MKEVNYYVETYINSLLKDDQGSIKPLDDFTIKHIFENNREYITRMHKYVLEGRKEFKERVEEARLIVFNKEEFMQWIEKFKKDCKGEINKAQAELNSVVGSSKKGDSRYLKKTGRLTGLHMEAERFERMINAINPINKKKPNYEKLDSLEAFDKVLIESDDIPGFYSTPSHQMEKPQKYQIKNLKKDWIERLEWGQKNPERIIKEEYGDIKYYYDSYHREFKWQLINIRPRKDIKNFLTYHYQKFQYDKEIFVNHIDCRIKESLKDYASSNHMIYEKIIEDWIAEIRDLISDKQEEFLVGKVYRSCEKFLDDIIENIKRNNENSYNTVIKNYINAGIEDKGWKAYDQSIGGKTLTYTKESSQAFRDIIIDNKFGNRISTIECLRIKSVPKSSTKPEECIRLHVNKIFHNEPIGISPLFIIVYAEQINFEIAWNKYFEYINEVDFPKYNKIETQEFKIGNLRPANLKILLTKHKREMNIIKMYHFFVNMNP